MLDEGCSRHQRLRQRCAKTKINAGHAALVVERRGGLLKSLATEQQLFEVLARPYFDSLIDPEARAWLKGC